MQHVNGAPFLAGMFVAALVVLCVATPYFLKQHKIYGSMFEFASTVSKVFTGIAVALVVGIGIFFSTPYSPPSSKEIAIVLGNTQNTPAPSIAGDIADLVSETMLQHKGSDTDDIADSIKFISAVKNPTVVNFRSLDIKIHDISTNSSNAKRDAKRNVEAISEKINQLTPTDNGANYVEAIVKARDNVEPGSRIIVIGSGLSDTGDLDFSKTSLLTNEDSRTTALDAIQEKYGANYLEGYTVEFYGLGDTNTPQEALSSIQKGVVRDIYKDAIRQIGGKVTMHTQTKTGPSVETAFVVGTTDTGCGDIKLIFDDEDLKFVGDRAIFIDEALATKTLSTVQDIWNQQKDTIEAIQVDGYTAHYPGADSLSQDRADTVKNALVRLGVSSDRITATGKGYGPYETDAQNRTVKVNISRNNKQCSN